MLLFGSSLLVLWFLNVLVSFLILQCSIYHWYHRHFHAPLFFSLAWNWYSSLFSFSFNFILWCAGLAKSNIRQVSFFIIFSLTITRSGLKLGDMILSQNPREFCESLSLGFWLEYMPLVCKVKLQFLAKSMLSLLTLCQFFIPTFACCLS